MSRFSFKNLISSIARIMEEEPEETGHKKSPQQRSHENKIQSSILVLAAAVIRCDRNYTTGTEKFIRDFFTLQFGGAGLSQRMKMVPEHIDIGTEPFTRIACKELKLLTTHDSRLSIIRFLFGVAAADDFVNAKETRCIQRIATYLDVSAKDLKEIQQQFLSENNPYKILGVEEGITYEEVRVAYRKMVLKYHPDKRPANVTEEEASLKFREIKRAYEIIKNNTKK